MTGKTSSRRAQGGGTIYFDEKKKRYIGALTIAGRRRKVSATTITDARAKLSKLTAAKTTGAPVDDQAFTVGQAVALFMERDVPNRTSNGRPLAPSTVETYRWTAQLITDEIGRARLAVLATDDVEAMLDRLTKHRGLSAASLRKVRGTLQRSIDFAMRRGKVGRNVARHATITPAAAGTDHRRSLSPTDARTLLAALRDERNGAMYALSLRIGLRPGEAAGLFWEDLHGHVLNVTRAVRVAAARASVSDEMKTSGSRRTIELPAELVDWLAEHRARQVTERLAAPRWHDDRLMFATSNGTVIHPRNTRRELSAICARAGVADTRPNELRHSCASLLSDIGVRNEEIADLLGHTTTRMVDQTYRHRLRPVVDIAARADWAAK